MMTPNELRVAADCLRDGVDVLCGDKLADLCEHLAGVTSPRILKASEITEPGWYVQLSDKKQSGMHRVYYLYNGTQVPANYYGPIPLPE